MDRVRSNSWELPVDGKGTCISQFMPKRSWTYKAGPLDHPLTGLNISFTNGWLRVSAPSNPCSLVTMEPREQLALSGGYAHDYSG